MRLSAGLTSRIWNSLFRAVAMRRPADFVIGGVDDPYLLRWWLLGGRTAKDGTRISKSILGLVSPYLHCFRRSDDDRAHHDHPGPSVSLILAGRCLEHTIAAGGIHKRRELRPGMIVFRSSTFAHRIEVIPGVDCWTLFVFGPKWRKQWYFHCPERGLVPWQDFTAASDRGAVGRGCGEQ